MRPFLHRRPGLARARGFGAAGGGRRWVGARTVDGVKAAIPARATTAARRAGWYARNTPWVAAAVDSLAGNVVGPGIKPQGNRIDHGLRSPTGSDTAMDEGHAALGYPTPQEVRQQVMIGRVDATISEGTEAAFRINQAGGGLRIAYVYPASFTYGIYIQPDDANTAAVVATLRAMQQDGFFEALAEAYGLDPSVFDVDYDS